MKILSILIIIAALPVQPLDLTALETNRWYTVTPRVALLEDTGPNPHYQDSRSWCSMIKHPDGGVLYYGGFYDDLRGSTIYANAMYHFDPNTEVCSMLVLSNWKKLPTAGGGYLTVPLPANDTVPTPVDRHTYSHFRYCPYDNSVYIYSGANQSYLANEYGLKNPHDVWRFSLDEYRWIKIADFYYGLDSTATWTPVLFDLPYHYDPVANRMLFFHSLTKITVYDPATGSWSYKGTPANAAAVDAVIGPFGTGNTYDTKRNLICIYGGNYNTPQNELIRYDPSANAYEVVVPAGGKPPVDLIDTWKNYSNLTYLAGEDVYLTVVNRETWVYSPDANTWTELPVADNASLYDFKMYMAYDSVHGVIIGANETLPLFYVMKPDLSGTTRLHRDPSATDEPRLSVSPNPFNPRTAISVKVKENGEGAVYIHNVNGRLIEALYLPPSTHHLRRAVWDAGGLPSGVYLLKAKVGSRVMIKRLFLEK